MISLKIGQELVARGHRFSILISDADELSQSVLDGAEGVRLLTFKGPPFHGTEEWAATLPQDPAEVLIKFSHVFHHCKSSCFLLVDYQGIVSADPNLT